MVFQTKTGRRGCLQRLEVAVYFVAISGLSHHVVAFSTHSSHRTSIPWSLGTSTLDSETQSVERVLESVRAVHDSEVAAGFDVFGRSDTSFPKKEWTDDDFFARSVGVGNAGPDEFVLTRGDEIFGTKAPVLSKDECNELIAEAKEVIEKGLEQDGVTQDQSQKLLTNSQLGEARVSQMPRAKDWLRQALHERFFPILESRFGIPADEITLHDALIIGYGYFGGAARSQPVHRDSSLLSLNVALSPRSDYDANGGGTFFESLPAESCVIQTEQGHVLCHSGGTPHAGRGIASGERWILVLFCVAKNQPQLARRCHARGMVAKSEGDLQEADAIFRAGLSVAPNDHLLHTSLGSVHMAKGDEASARNSLSAAALSYLHCPKANLGLARTMFAGGQPRAALRRFETVLEWMEDRDLASDAWEPLRAIGWDARVGAAHTAILCVQEGRKVGVSFDPTTTLPKAIGRLKVALEAAPGEGHLLGLIARAEQLLLEESDSNEKL